MTPIEIAITTGVLSIFGVLCGNSLTYWLNERSKKRSQHLDLYKVVYPERLKAVTSIMNKAGAVFMDLRAYYVGSQDSKEATRLQEDLKTLFWLAQANEFLLGEDVVKLVGEFRIACINGFLVERERSISPILPGDVWVHEASFKQLTEAARNLVYLNKLDLELVLSGATTPRSLAGIPSPKVEQPKLKE